MLRIAFSFVGSFVLFYLQSLIVMNVFHYDNIYFPHFSQVLMVCIINFFLVFSILSQITPWFMKLSRMEAEEE